MYSFEGCANKLLLFYLTLQMTFQACSISEARYLYDQLAVVTPIVVSITM